MIRSIVATVTVKPESLPAFESLARELVAAVNADEPGCLLYTLNRGDDPSTWMFIERYADEAAVQAHRESAHFRRLRPAMNEYLVSPPVTVRMAEVAP